MANATLLVIDECHHATAPSYTSILSRLGFATGAALRRREDRRMAEPVLLGLSATPFRSAGEEESRLLAQRFGDRVLPSNQSGLYDRLEQRGILSRITYAPIDADYRFDLEPEELLYLNKANDLPKSALARLSDLEDRNERIIDLITEADEQSILLFANSVRHATHLAARLSLRGIRSRVVHAVTDRSARRAAVAAFRNGEVQVICNAGVFATGFDAPKVDMVLISRPVFSPVRYLQMVGRGLRGPANGGTERCKVVTLVDNIIGYGRTRGPEFWQDYYQSWAVD